jgi:hypothetical protein
LEKAFLAYTLFCEISTISKTLKSKAIDARASGRGLYSYLFECLGSREPHKTVDKSPEFGEGPIVLGSPAKVKVSLYVPKSALEFPDHNKRFYMQGWTECPAEENDITNLQKIYEVPRVFDVEPLEGVNYSGAHISANWDGKTDPQSDNSSSPKEASVNVVRPPT